MRRHLCECDTALADIHRTEANACFVHAPRTFRDIYDHLECSRQRRSRSDVSDILNARLSKLQSCGDPFPRRSSASKSQVQSGNVRLPDGTSLKVDQQQKDLCERISERYELDEVEALVLLRAFLESEDRSLDLLARASAEEGAGPKSARAKGKAVDLTDDFLDAFNVFYFEERLYVLRIVGALLRIAEDEYHEYFDVAAALLEKLATPAFSKSCLEQFKSRIRQDLPESVRDSQMYMGFWAKQSLREQLCLLEIVFLLYYSRLAADARTQLDILKTLRETDFGRRQANSGFFDAEAQDLQACITHLITLISIESLDLEKIMEGIELPDAPSPDTLVGSPADLRATIDFFEDTPPDPHYSPILLAWALCLNRIETALADRRESDSLPEHLRQIEEVLQIEDSATLWTRLASAAFGAEMALFPTMLEILGSPLISSTSTSSAAVSVPSALAYRAVFKGLLLSVTELVRAEFVPDWEGLISVWEATFGGGHAVQLDAASGVAALCAQFWSEDVDIDTRRSVIETARRRFPVQFRHLLRLMRVLTGQCSIEALPSSERSAAVVQASQSVLDYLAAVPTLAHVLPPKSDVLPGPYEVEVGSTYEQVVYCATHEVPIFGPLVIPPGTSGRLISELGRQPAIVLWEMPYSAWKLMLSVLSSFIDTDPGRSRAAQEDDHLVFEERSHATLQKFGQLAPENSMDGREDVAADILDLFAAVLCGGHDLRVALFDHLSSDGEHGTPDLVAIAFRVLEQALSCRPMPSRLITSALKVLTLLLPSRPGEIWLQLRSSNIITGSSGNAPYLTNQRLDPSALLEEEMSKGSYSATIALIDFINALLLELQRSHYAIAADLCKLKVDVILRGLEWVTNLVWPEYQSWKYMRLREKLEIGRKATAIFNTIFQDGSLSDRGATPPSATIALSGALEKVFISHATLIHFAPLVEILGTGQQLIDQLHRSARQAEGSQAEALVEQSLLLARLILLRRRDIRKERPSLLELLFFDHATVATRVVGSSDRKSAKVELANAVFGYVLLPVNSDISTEAARLITALCRSTAEVGQPPSLVGYLGTTAELEATITGVIDIVGNTHQSLSLRICVWTMIAAIVDSQPALATLFLTGRHLATHAESRIAASGQTNSSNTNKVSSDEGNPHIGRTAMEVAAEALEISDELWESKPALLEAILRFFDTAWQHSLEHFNAFEKLRQKASFWQSLNRIALKEETGPAPTQPEGFTNLDGIIHTVGHLDTVEYCHRVMSQARALRLLASDVQFTPTNNQKGKGKDGSKRSGSIESIVSLVSNSNQLKKALGAAVAVHCTPDLHADVDRRFKTSLPEIPLESLRKPPRRDDFDMNRQFGDDYVYAGDTLRRKLEGFLGELDEYDIQQTMLRVCAVNLEWSAIDAQVAHLRAWTQLFELALGRLLAEENKDVSRACLEAWIACAKTTSEERRDGEVMFGVHDERVALLTVLAEAAWAREHAQTAQVADLLQAMEQARMIVDHDVFRTEDSVRGARKPQHHRGVFQIVLLCTRQYRQVLASRAVITNVQHKAFHRAIDTFSAHAISSLRQIVDNAKAVSTSDESRAAEEDFMLVASLLELLVRSDVGLRPHFWLGRFQETSLFRAMIDLLARAPLAAVGGTNRPDVVQPLYAETVLSLLLALATQPASAEQLALSGVMTALTSNAITAQVEEVQVAPILFSGERNPVHLCWCLMLNIVVSLIDRLGTASGRFVEMEVEGFVRVYGAQIGHVLSFAPLAKMATNTGLTMAHLEEIDVVVKLFYYMTRSDSRTRSAAGILSTFAERTTWLLQQLVYVLQHPRELKSLIDPDAAQLDGTAAAELSRIEGEMNDKILEICLGAVGALWEQTGGAAVISREPIEWPQGKAIISAVSGAARRDTVRLPFGVNDEQTDNR